MRTRTNHRLIASALLAGAVLLLGSTALADHPASLDGELELVNDRLVPVSVTIDGRFQGRVPPQRARVFAGIPNGTRLVSIDSPGVPATTSRVSVPARSRARVHAAPIMGRAAVINDSGVPMRVRLGDLRLGVIEPGARVRSPDLLPGRVTLVAKPAGPAMRGATPKRLTVDISAGHPTRVHIGAYLGSIKVRNPARRPAAVIVDGHRVGRVGPGQVLVVANQLPGSHKVELRRRQRTLATAIVEVAFGQRVVWAPHRAHRRAHAHMGRVEVHNATGRMITLRLEGSALGTLRPGERRIFGDLPTGTHDLVAQLSNGRRLRQLVTVRHGGTASVSVGVQSDWRPRPAGTRGVRVAWSY